ncbi:hypothetical protein QJQ45_028353 [Haematococcus lacustris]|nr:hypothetical protein QJQ45_028353 [Haematococcus lacustris]
MVAHAALCTWIPPSDWRSRYRLADDPLAQLSSEHQSKLKTLQLQLAADGSWDSVRHDLYSLRRFAKARGWDLAAAAKMWKDMLDFRKQNQVDQILTDFVYKEKDAVLEVFPQGLHKTDRQGRPVMVYKFGAADIKKLRRITSDERLIRFHIQENERIMRQVLPACSVLLGRHVEKMTTLIDIAGLSMGDVSAVLDMLKAFAKVDGSNYPETLGCMVIVNVPWIMKGLFSGVKVFMAPETQKKMEVLDTSYHTRLHQLIAPDSLLAEYGGTSQGRLGDAVGPWTAALFSMQAIMGPMQPPAPTPALEVQLGSDIMLVNCGQVTLAAPAKRQHDPAGFASDTASQHDAAERHSPPHKRQQGPQQPALDAHMLLLPGPPVQQGQERARSSEVRVMVAGTSSSCVTGDNHVTLGSHAELHLREQTPQPGQRPPQEAGVNTAEWLAVLDPAQQPASHSDQAHSYVQSWSHQALDMAPPTACPAATALAAPEAAVLAAGALDIQPAAAASQLQLQHSNTPWTLPEQFAAAFEHAAGNAELAVDRSSMHSFHSCRSHDSSATSLSSRSLAYYAAMGSLPHPGHAGTRGTAPSSYFTPGKAQQQEGVAQRGGPLSSSGPLPSPARHAVMPAGFAYQLGSRAPSAPVTGSAQLAPRTAPGAWSRPGLGERQRGGVEQAGWGAGSAVSNSGAPERMSISKVEEGDELPPSPSRSRSPSQADLLSPSALQSSQAPLPSSSTWYANAATASKRAIPLMVLRWFWGTSGSFGPEAPYSQLQEAPLPGLPEQQASPPSLPVSPPAALQAGSGSQPGKADAGSTGAAAAASSAAEEKAQQQPEGTADPSDTRTPPSASYGARVAAALIDMGGRWKAPGMTAAHASLAGNGHSFAAGQNGLQEQHGLQGAGGLGHDQELSVKHLAHARQEGSGLSPLQQEGMCGSCDLHRNSMGTASDMQSWHGLGDAVEDHEQQQFGRHSHTQYSRHGSARRQLLDPATDQEQDTELSATGEMDLTGTRSAGGHRPEGWWGQHHKTPSRQHLLATQQPSSSAVGSATKGPAGHPGHHQHHPHPPHPHSSQVQPGSPSPLATATSTSHGVGVHAASDRRLLGDGRHHSLPSGDRSSLVQEPAAPGPALSSHGVPLAPSGLASAASDDMVLSDHRAGVASARSLAVSSLTARSRHARRLSGGSGLAGSVTVLNASAVRMLPGMQSLGRRSAQTSSGPWQQDPNPQHCGGSSRQQGCAVPGQHMPWPVSTQRFIDKPDSEDEERQLLAGVAHSSGGAGRRGGQGVVAAVIRFLCCCGPFPN